MVTEGFVYLDYPEAVALHLILMMKKLLHRLFCIVVGCLLGPHPMVAQTPQPARKYTTVERLQPARLQAVKADRERYQRERKSVNVIKQLKDLRAIMHVHAEDSAHTGGTRPELLAACKRTGVQVVLLTNHVRPPVDFINDSWRGLREGVLFIPGAEHEGFLAYPQTSIMNRKTASRAELISAVTANGGNIFLSHIEERPDWATDQLTGMEIYNHHADFKTEREFLGWLQMTLADPDGIANLQKLLADYPQEFFGSQQDYLADYIAKWDADSQLHRVTGIAANDCHHNQVITVKVAAPDAIEIWLTGDKEPTFKVTAKKAPRIPELTQGKAVGEVIAQVDIDPYERSLRYVTTHILAAAQTESAVRTALTQAHAYVAHDWLCDPTGFAFVANQGKRQVGVMGDEIKFAQGLQLRVAAPVAATIKLFRNGKLVQTAEAQDFSYALPEPGTYRAEVWLSLDGELRPWIYANPIRVLTATR